MVQVNMQSHILGANELLARKNRSLFGGNKVLALNLMSSPGSGKTTILERTIETLGDKIKIGVIEGDLYTDQDAQRIEKKGFGWCRLILKVPAIWMPAWWAKPTTPWLLINLTWYLLKT